MAFSAKARNELKPPSITYGMHLKALARLRQHGVPDNLINSDVIRGDWSNDIYRDIIRSWRYLGLVNASGQPEESLRQLVDADQQHSQQILRKILASSYRFLFGPEAQPLSAEQASVQELSQQFEQQGISKKSVGPYVFFFRRLAADAGMLLAEEPVEEQEAVEPEDSLPNKVIADVTPLQETTQNVTEVPKVQQDSFDFRQLLSELIIAKFPAFDPKWTSEVQQEWWLSFRQILHILSSEKALQSQ